MNVLPGIVAAIVILVIGYFVALALGYIVKKVLVKAGLDNWMRKARLDDAIGHINLSSLAAIITKWYVFILFLIPAAEAINTIQLGVLLSRLATWLPNLIIALIIFLFGLVVADYAGDKIMRAKMKGIKLMSDIARWIIIIFMTLIALKQINVTISIAENILLLLVGAVVLAIALAVGIGFGYGFRDEAKEIIKAVKKRI